MVDECPVQHFDGGLRGPMQLRLENYDACFKIKGSAEEWPTRQHVLVS